MHIRKLLDNGRKRVNQLHKVINPRRACTARVTVLGLLVCFPYFGSMRDEKCNERYHRVKRQICGNIKMAFFLKLSYSKVRAFFTYLGRGGHL